MTVTRLTIESYGKVYEIDTSDWTSEKWRMWGDVTEEWTAFHYFCFTRYLDSVNDDVWDAIQSKRKVAYMGHGITHFCRRAMIELRRFDIMELPSEVYASIDYKALFFGIKIEMENRGLKVIEEADTGIFYTVRE